MSMHLRGPAYNQGLTDEAGDDADRRDGGCHVRPVTISCPKCGRTVVSLFEQRCAACWEYAINASVRMITDPDEEP